MSKKYIIGIKNPEPAEPEFVYYCGLSHSTRDDPADILWSANIDGALLLMDMYDAAADCQLIIDSGYPTDDIKVYEAEMHYALVDLDKIGELMAARRIDRILNLLDRDDINYLKSIGVLDLTNVT